MKPQRPEGYTTGRPTKYTDEMPQRVLGYVDECIKSKTLPTIAELSIIIDISKETINVWRKEPEKVLFSDALKKLEAYQEHFCLGRMVDKDTFATGQIFLLKCKHGYKEEKGDTITINNIGDGESLDNALKTLATYKNMMDEE